MSLRLYIGLIGGFLISITNAQTPCTFNTTFRSKIWHDNTKGTLTFSNTTMTGWTFHSLRSGSSSQTVNKWQCVEHASNNSYLVLRTQTTFSMSVFGMNMNLYAYLCMALTNITEYSFYYYQRNIPEPNLGYERLKVSSLAIRSAVDVCDFAASVPASEYHVLVLKGYESRAAINCPNSLLFSGDYEYIAAPNTQYCNTSQDTWDDCTNTTQMTFNYTTCSQKVAYSENGTLSCVANINSNGYDYTVVYNEDSTITSSSKQFSCICTDGTYASVAPNNCTAYQTPYKFPLLADQTTTNGHKLVVTKVYTTCGTTTGVDSSTTNTGLTSGEIAAIVVSILLFFMFCAACVVIVAVVTLFVFGIILLSVSGYSGQAGTITLSLDVNYKIDAVKSSDYKPDIITSTNPLPELRILSPSNIIVTNEQTDKELKTDKKERTDRPCLHKSSKSKDTNSDKTPFRP